MIFTINIDLYLTDVAFLVETSLDEFERFYYDNVKNITDEEYKCFRNDIEDEKNCAGFASTTDSGKYIVYLRYADTDLFVAHEIYHIVNRILMDRGIQHTYDDEPYAYLDGWLTDMYYNTLDEMRNSDNKENKS